MFGDLLEATPNPLREAGFKEVVLTMFLESFDIESVLEVFESQGEVEDVDVYTHWGLSASSK